MIRLIHGDGCMVVRGENVKIDANGGDLLYMVVAGLRCLQEEADVITWDLIKEIGDRCKKVYGDEEDEDDA